MSTEEICDGVHRRTFSVLLHYNYSVLLYFLFFVFTTYTFAQDFWVKSGLDSSDVEFLATTKDSSIFAGILLPGIAYSHSIFRSTDGGNFWMEFNHGLPEKYIINRLVTDNMDYVFVAADSFLYRARNLDTMWTKVFSSGSGNVILSAVGNSLGVVFTGTYGGEIYKSTDHGESWQLSYVAFDSASRETGEIWELCISKTGKIIASIKTFHGYWWVIRSTDGGINWTELDGSNYLLSFTVNSISGSIMGMGYWGTWGLFRSTDEGETWTFIDSSLSLNEYVPFKFDAYGKLYAGGTYGVLISSDEGSNWLNITHNLPFPAFVRSLAISCDDYLYIGTDVNFGIWKSAERITSVEEGNLSNYPREFALLQNYPNPFNPSTQITFSVPKATDVTLKVFDVLGREIAVLVNERKQPGEYKVSWNAEGIPSGVYFYRIVAGEYIETKKMVAIH